MRKHYKTPRVGQKRRVRKFLFFPLKLDGELRWWERATITQIYEPKDSQGRYHWRNLRWSSECLY